MSGVNGESAAELWIAEAIEDEEQRWIKFLGRFAIKSDIEDAS